MTNPLDDLFPEEQAPIFVEKRERRKAMSVRINVSFIYNILSTVGILAGAAFMVPADMFNPDQDFITSDPGAKISASQEFKYCHPTFAQVIVNGGWDKGTCREKYHYHAEYVVNVDNGIAPDLSEDILMTYHSNAMETSERIKRNKRLNRENLLSRSN